MRLVAEDAGHFPEEYYSFLRRELTYPEFVDIPHIAQAMKHATSEVHQIKLGPSTREETDELIGTALAAAGGHDEPWVLIGGPPCQAYSLVGRARRTGDPTFATDEKHLLYREYLHIIRKFRPAIFVMENVKGMLSSQHEGGAIFRKIMDDLRGPDGDEGYDVYSFVAPGRAELQPKDFIIRSELYGVPQKRHRVILLGVLRATALPAPRQLIPLPLIPVSAAIGDLPPIRSRLTPRTRDSESAWAEQRLIALSTAGKPPSTGRRIPPVGEPFMPGYVPKLPAGPLADWLLDGRIAGVTLHESRAHMAADLVRYGYLAERAKHEKRSPRLGDLPVNLRPEHRNAASPDAPFNDRFRVQLRHEPSTTVVSHIAKDGHYYIHYDASQMRSLSVREAARLQTFPDNYFFMGNRTQQYQQVGNAVPPLLARALAEVVAGILGRA
ncbi:DNA cytosine methyltransferase [Intrasporangium calvum]|uniref:DNA (cytosine-5-)-methyltransferase n=1 Tax=Intrasporangium calvum TaxID=53358 RepID=A0ABT5GDG3_9MICO|nr:DNA cytosine methyltransferase [Intrasporangium calvum]MDC5696312.1 DNA cytosine methyltransferase [Intrasporangium calvum]